MKQSIIETRTLNEASYMLDNCCTVRECAKHFGFGKSTVHTDMTKRLKNLSVDMYEQIKTLLDINKEECTIRGGLATKNKFTNKC